MYKWICLMTTKAPPKSNIGGGRLSTSPSPFRRNQFGTKSLSIPRPKQRPIRTSPMSDYLYSPTQTYDSNSPYSAYFGNSTENKTSSTNGISVQTSTGCFSHFQDSYQSHSKQTYLGSDYSANSPTSPGSISSAFRQNGSSSRSVFNVLYKPDLIKLSSPLILRKNYPKSDIVTRGKTSEITPSREEMTTRWVKETSNTK